MSVRVLETDEFDSLVAAARHAGLADSDDAADWLGHTLMRANVSAYRQRYGLTVSHEAIPNAPGYRYRAAAVPDLHQLYDVLGDYLYNVDAWTGWPGSEAANIIETLINVFYPLPCPAALLTQSEPVANERTR